MLVLCPILKKRKNNKNRLNMKHLNIFLSLAFMTICLLTIEAQTPIVIDPDNYKTKSTPYLIPDLPSTAEYYVTVKGGEPIYITLTGIVKGSASYYVSNKSLTITEDTVKMDGYVGNILVNFRKNFDENVIHLYYHYQADIYDRTIGSATYGKRPDFIWINTGTSANISGSPRFSYYKWKSINDASFVGDLADSTRIYNQGTYICRLNDNSLLIDNWSNDTIFVLEKPTLSNTSKTLAFSSTTAGITYKLLKAIVINGTDTTWTESENFVGDGNSKNIMLTDGKYKLTTTFGIHTAVYPYGYFVVNTTTAAEKTKEDNLNYRLTDNNLLFDNEVNLKFYSLQGQLLQQENGSSFKLVRETGIFTATDKNGNTLTAKILLK